MLEIFILTIWYQSLPLFWAISMSISLGFKPYNDGWYQYFISQLRTLDFQDQDRVEILYQNICTHTAHPKKRELKYPQQFFWETTCASGAAWSFHKSELPILSTISATYI